MKKGDILVWDCDRVGYAVKKGQKAIAISDVNDDGLIIVKWIDNNSGKNNSGYNQLDGGYFSTDFRLLDDCTINMIKSKINKQNKLFKQMLKGNFTELDSYIQVTNSIDNLNEKLFNLINN